MAAVPDHDVVGLDVLMDDANYLVAVVHGLEHVDEVIARLPDRYASVRLPDVFTAGVQAYNDIAEATVLVVVSDEVKIAVRIIDNLVQPENVRVFKLLEHFELLFDRVVGVPSAVSNILPTKRGLVHLLDCEFLPSASFSREIYLGKATLTDPFDLLVPVDFASLH